jgi:hypothetical protein
VLRQSVGRLARSTFVYGVARTVAALAWGALVLLVPSRLGADLMGEVWGVAHPLLVPLTISTALIGLTGGPEIGLRALGAARRSLRARVANAVLTMLGVVVGAVLADGLGAAWGYAVANAVAWVYWRQQLRWGLRDWAGEQDGGADGGQPHAPRVVGDFIYEPPWERQAEATRPRPPTTPAQSVPRRADQNGSARAAP